MNDICILFEVRQRGKLFSEIILFHSIYDGYDLAIATIILISSV